MSNDEKTTVKLCELDSVDDDSITTTTIDGRIIAYGRVDGEWFAIDDTCTHGAVSLSDGYLEADDKTIECPLHGSLFSLETGEALTLPAIKPVARHSVEQKDDGVFITIEGDAQ